MEIVFERNSSEMNVLTTSWTFLCNPVAKIKVPRYIERLIDQGIVEFGEKTELKRP